MPSGVQLWDDVHLYFDTPPASIERVSVPAPSEEWQLYQFRVTMDESVQPNGGVLAGFRMADGSALPSPENGDIVEFDDFIVSLGSEFPSFGRSPQDDLRASSVGTVALAANAATGITVYTAADFVFPSANTNSSVALSVSFPRAGVYEVTTSARASLDSAATTDGFIMQVNDLFGSATITGESSGVVWVPVSAPTSTNYVPATNFTVTCTGSGPWSLDLKFRKVPGNQFTMTSISRRVTEIKR